MNHDSLLPSRGCIRCGRAIYGNAKIKYCIVCKEIVIREQDAARRKRKRSGSIRQHGSQDFCQICGKSYTVRSGAQKFCLECREQKYKSGHKDQTVEITETTDTPPSIGNNIRSLRLRAGYTQRELGLLIGSVTQQRIAKWENNLVVPSARYLLLLSHALFCSVEDILSLEDHFI